MQESCKEWTDAHAGLPKLLLVNCFSLASFGRACSLWPQGISILHSTHLHPVQPSLQGHMGGPGKHPHPWALLTFAPPLAIALDRQPLRVLLHPDHTRLLWNLWLRGAVGHDHVDLPPFKIQLSPLPHVNILHRRSRHNKARTEMPSGRKAHSRNNGTWFHSSASCSTPCSVTSGPAPSAHPP